MPIKGPNYRPTPFLFYDWTNQAFDIRVRNVGAIYASCVNTSYKRSKWSSSFECTIYQRLACVRHPNFQVVLESKKDNTQYRRASR
jgi:hypothetical protein